MTSDSKNNIYVTRPFLPPLDEFIPSLAEIWESGFLSNNGPYHQEFERKLAEYLGVNHLSLFANATLALVTALQALRVQGEVITTPYSFVATSHALLWNGIKPVFVDIDPSTCNIDPDKIEAAITPNTQAILAVHCYGRPCEVNKIQRIADIYGLKVIYDAAHAFGVTFDKGSLFSHGDCSILSFHATKVFNTFEGGALICNDAVFKQRIDYLKNFGFADETTVVAPGINGKMSEFNAALGLSQLEYIDAALQGRALISDKYRSKLDSIKGIVFFGDDSEYKSNNSYFPILVGPDYPLSRDELYEAMKNCGVYARRYFYPLISDFPMYRGLESAKPCLLENASAVSKAILCLPIYPDLTDEDIDRVVAVIKGGSDITL